MPIARIALFALLMAALPAFATGFLSVSPTYIGFSPTEPGGPFQSRTLLIQNLGDEDLDGIWISSQCNGDFRVMGYCPYTLPAHQTCQADVQFFPQTIGSQYCNIMVQAFGAASAMVSVQALVQNP